MPIATFVNAAAIVAGAVAGVLLGDRLPVRARTAVLSAIGLVTLVVGMDAALGSTNIIIPLLALAAGGLIGEALRLEARVESIGERLRRRFARDEGSRFVDGFVTATLIATVGPLTILGSLAEGATGDRQLILVKSALDAFMALGVASALGIGVAFSALGVLVVQVPITVVGALAGDSVTGRVLAEIEATGGIIVLAIGLRLLDVKRLPIASYLPALALAPLMLYIGERIVG